MKMAPRERHQLQFKPIEKDQLWGFSLLFNTQESLEGKRECLRGPLGLTMGVGDTS